jgi:hypothetical protein
MFVAGSLRLIFRLATVAALLAVAEAGPCRMPGSLAVGNPALDRRPVDLPARAATPRLQNFARTPLYFEPNQGQTDAQVQYLARGPGYTVFLTATEAVLMASPVAKADNLTRTDEPSQRPTSASQASVVRIQLIGGNPAAQAQGLDRLPGIANYFLGNDPSQWRTHIPTYARVEYQEVYPGIGLVYYGNPRHLEYDFVVGPGADPSQIRLRFAGAQSVRVGAGGELVAEAGEHVLLQGKPIVYQNVAGERREIAVGFVVQGQEVSFALGSYDRGHALVVDPVLSYSTYLGGSGSDDGRGIAVDAAGNAYVTGYVTSPDFPTVNALQPTAGGYVAKLSADGSALVYCTYLGGSSQDVGGKIAVDTAGNAYVIGTTFSADFPTVNALQPYFGGGDGDAFVAKLTADGSALVYSTYLGGSGRERGNCITVDAAGNAYVTGATNSADFPTSNPLQPVLGNLFFNAFVAKLTADGSALVYSTYLGGSSGTDRAFGIAVDAAGNAYVSGLASSPDFPRTTHIGPPGGGFVAKLEPTGSSLVYSTTIGGAGAHGIAVDGAGSAYVVGGAGSGFPTVNALQPAPGGPNGNAFVAKLTADGSALIYSTYLGGSGGDVGAGIAVDAAGNAYVTGSASSTDFPTANPFQSSLHGVQNAFVAKLTADGSALVYSTYLGGSGGEAGSAIAVDTTGNAYVTGLTASSDFPTANPLQPGLRGMQNAFVAKIGTVVTPGPAVQFQVSAPARVASNTPFDVTVTALDANGLTAIGYLGTTTFRTTDTDPGVILPPDHTFTAADQGVHTFAGGCTLITPGNQTLTATDTTNATITGNATFTVNPGP